MIECPICHAKCFDDMDTCYGCMHRFSREDVQMQADRPMLSIPLVDVPAKTAPRHAAGEPSVMRVPVEGAGCQLVITVQTL